MTPERSEAEALASELERHNLLRRELTAQVLTQVRPTLSSTPQHPILIATGEGYPAGVLGLVASQLVEEWYRPALVISVGSNGLSRASGRSIPEFNLVRALQQCRELFLRFGGHPMAAGFEMRTDLLDSLRERLVSIARQELQGVALLPHWDIDAQVDLGAIQGEAISFLQSLAPFGPGNRAPVFLSRGVEVADARTMGAAGDHLKLALRRGGAVWNAVAFGQAKGWAPGTRRIDVVYTVGEDSWLGQQTLRLRVLDYAPRAES